MTVLKKALILYAVLGLIGAGFVGYRAFCSDETATKIVFRAKAELPSGTLLGADNLTYDQTASGDAAEGSDAVTKARALLVGQYLKTQVASKAAIQSTDVSPSPALMPAQGKAMLAVDISDASASATINAGTRVILCSGDQKVGMSTYPVATKLCSGTRCAAFLEIASDDPQNAALLGSGVALRVENATCLPTAQPAPSSAATK
jgi:hypothetical protein